MKIRFGIFVCKINSISKENECSASNKELYVLDNISNNNLTVLEILCVAIINSISLN